MFSCEFCKISQNTFLTEHLWMTASACEKGDELFQSVYVEPVSLTNEIGIEKNGHNHVDSTYIWITFFQKQVRNTGKGQYTCRPLQLHLLKWNLFS